MGVNENHMWKYILQRLLWLLVTVFCVSIMIFTIMFFIPGDPARIILGDSATAAQLADYHERMGLDDPFFVQLARYLYQTYIQFDLGTSYKTGLSVMSEFAERIPRTVGLSLWTIVIGCGVGIPLGIYSAIRRNGIMDHSLRIVSMILVSIPNFWLAMLMVQLFSQKLGWLPSYGIGGFQYWILPILAGGLGTVGSNARMTRSAVLETVRADYVTTARAKGQSEGVVIVRHMLPNAMIPIVNSLSGMLANLIGGSVVVETVFSFPGTGLYLMNGISNRDYPVIRSCVLILAVFSTLMVLLTDLVYAWLDPRIKAQYVSSKH